MGSPCGISYSSCSCNVLMVPPIFKGTTLMVLSSCVQTRRNSMCRFSTSGWFTLSSAGSFRRYVSAVSSMMAATQPPSRAREVSDHCQPSASGLFPGSSPVQRIKSALAIAGGRLTWSNRPVFVPASSKSVASQLTQADLLLEDAGRHGVKVVPKDCEDDTLLCAGHLVCARVGTPQPLLRTYLGTSTVCR